MNVFFKPVHSDVGKAAKKRDHPPPVFYTPSEHIEVIGDYAEVKVCACCLNNMLLVVL